MIRKIKQWFCTHNWNEVYPTKVGRMMQCKKCLKTHAVVDNWR